MNLQGDVVGLISASGSYVAKYTYDAWGNLLSVTNASGTAITSSTHIANRNPLRYRGYYFDSETGFYYLQSRYYDPVQHRFINADKYLYTNDGILGLNRYAYCQNKPTVSFDLNGERLVNIDSRMHTYETCEKSIWPKANLQPRTILNQTSIPKHSEESGTTSNDVVWYPYTSNTTPVSFSGGNTAEQLGGLSIQFPALEEIVNGSGGGGDPVMLYD